MNYNTLCDTKENAIRKYNTNTRSNTMEVTKTTLRKFKKRSQHKMESNIMIITVVIITSSCINTTRQKKKIDIIHDHFFATTLLHSLHLLNWVLPELFIVYHRRELLAMHPCVDIVELWRAGWDGGDKGQLAHFQPTSNYCG